MRNVYAYDAASQLMSLTYKKGTAVLGDLTYTSDAAGNRINVGGAFAQKKNSGGTVTATITRTYDGLDRLTNETTH